MSDRNRSLFWQAVGMAGAAECHRLASGYLKAVKSWA
jgi:hypothetical protein